MSESKIAPRVAQIKNAIRKRNLGFKELSELTGIPMSTLSPIFKKDWNPKLNTLLDIESAIFGKPKKSKARNVRNGLLKRNDGGRPARLGSQGTGVPPKEKIAS